MLGRLAPLLSFVASFLAASPALAAPDVTEAFTRPGAEAPQAPVAAPPPIAPVEAETPPRHEPRPPTRFATVYGGASLGTAAGALLGASVGLTLAGAIGCDARGQGWMAGYTCTSGYFYLATIGALIAMPIGTLLGTALALILEEVPLDALGEGLIGLLLGSMPAALAALLHWTTGQLSGPLVYALGVAAGLPPLLVTVWTHGHLDDHGFAMAPTVTPVAEGAVIGLSGRF